MCPPKGTFFTYLSRLLDFLIRSAKMSGETSGETDRPSDPPPPVDDFDPSLPSVPISYPIKTLDALASRSYFQSFHFPFNRASVPLPPPPPSASEGGGGGLPSRPRMLVCHDMQGGYTDDRWVQGGGNPGAYAIWHWRLMDVFVYFSHHLVTLPPPCWINAAHTHGVKVLGTFITEWAEGVEICKTLLSTKSDAHMYAERLAELASALGFDGWLINMEVKLEVTQIPNLKEFVGHLTRTMHALLPGSLVIWYDAVTNGGKLAWQDQLNMENKPFFDLCDGIFVNYTWKENYPKLSGDFAGDRRFDVYMGIDVFGRNTYAGGQWNTNIALDVLKKDNVSAAVFAPGWVYETQQPPDFETAQNRWWGLVEKSWGILQIYPKELPFHSDFDQGRGFHFSIGGLQETDNLWNNISYQSFQPALDFTGPFERAVLFNDVELPSYSGGGNITITGNFCDDSFFTSKLFDGRVRVGDAPLKITYSVMEDANSSLGLSIGFSSETSRTSRVLASNPDAFWTILLEDENCEIVEASSRRAAANKGSADHSWRLCEATIDMRGFTLTDIGVICGTRGWDENGALLAAHPYQAIIGHVSIRDADRAEGFPRADAWSTGSEYVTWARRGPGGSKSVSLKLTWELEEGDSARFTRYGIHVENLFENPCGGPEARKFLGMARVEAYYVSDLGVPDRTMGLRFTIQPFGPDGTFQNVDEAPALVLVVEQQ